MTRVCRICLEDTPDDEDYHLRCLRSLFKTSKVPTLDIEVSTLHVAAMEMIGHTSLSGIQKKISVNLENRRTVLRVAAEGGHYILKPQSDFTAVPENEHVTTCLAQLSGIAVAPNGLIPLKDGSLAYIVQRFDRLANSHKLRQEDFCQLAEKAPKEKYDGSGELCFRLLKRYATEPPVETIKLFRMLVFSWWTYNGDMHLKNFSLLADEKGFLKLTPAYDLLCTRLAIPKDITLAMPIDGKKDKLTRNTWLEFAEYCELLEKPAKRVLDEQISILDDATRLIDRSFLPDDQKVVYKKLIVERTDVLRGETK
jgi:serine/threonine-protein kinase HipA